MANICQPAASKFLTSFKLSIYKLRKLQLIATTDPGRLRSKTINWKRKTTEKLDFFGNENFAVFPQCFSHSVHCVRKNKNKINNRKENEEEEEKNNTLKILFSEDSTSSLVHSESFYLVLRQWMKASYLTEYLEDEFEIGRPKPFLDMGWRQTSRYRAWTLNYPQLKFSSLLSAPKL